MQGLSRGPRMFSTPHCNQGHLTDDPVERNDVVWYVIDYSPPLKPSAGNLVCIIPWTSKGFVYENISFLQVYLLSLVDLYNPWSFYSATVDLICALTCSAFSLSHLTFIWKSWYSLLRILLSDICRTLAMALIDLLRLLTRRFNRCDVDACYLEENQNKHRSLW